MVKLQDLLPIRKVAVGLVAYVISVAALKVSHVDLGPGVAENAAEGFVTFAAMWWTKDPRVKAVVAGVESSPFAQAVATEIERVLATSPDLATKITRAVASEMLAIPVVPPDVAPAVRA